MPKKKYLDVCQTVRVLEARAGVIPASDWVVAEQRARLDCIVRTVRAYAKLLGRCGSDDVAITDILSDLRLYCATKGLAFDELDRIAYEYHQDDAAENRWVEKAPGNWILGSRAD
jgi:hypothetical protein